LGGSSGASSADFIRIFLKPVVLVDVGSLCRAMRRDALVQQLKSVLQANKLANVWVFAVLEKANLDTEIGPLVTKINQRPVYRVEFWHAFSDALR
jgi:hypothetical protein